MVHFYLEFFVFICGLSFGSVALFSPEEVHGYHEKCATRLLAKGWRLPEPLLSWLTMETPYTVIEIRMLGLIVLVMAFTGFLAHLLKILG